MSMACKCDRCGKYLKLDSENRCKIIKIGVNLLNEVNYGKCDINRVLDLCNECHESLLKWIKNVDKEEK